MLRPNTLIQIEQQANSAYPSRELNTFILDFAISGEINSSWQNLTDTAKIRLPRSVYVEDQNGKLFQWAGKGIYGPDGSQTPLFLRGDRISIYLGYFYDNGDGSETLQMPSAPQFKGYITRIKNRIPIEIECEDEMFKLKQINAPNKLFKGSQYSVKTMLQELLAGTDYTVSDGGAEVNIGDFRTQNETIASVLERIRRDGSLYSYFRGTELRCSGIVYYPQEMEVQEVFAFQENIISDALEYTRKDDLNIAIKASTQQIKNTSAFNEDGSHKTERTRIEVLVGKDGEITDPKSFHGDIISFPVFTAKTKADLIKRAKEYLPKVYYTGFKGDFTTFGQPTVTHGNAAIIRDRVIPERNGTYLIKQVTTTFGTGGLRQKIATHLRIDQGFTASELNAGI